MGPSTLPGVLFLSTNILYEVAGVKLQLAHANIPGICVEIAGLVSVWYHWAQLYYGPERIEVQRVLLLDYCTASAAIFATTTLLVNVSLQVANGTLIPNNDLFLCVSSAMVGISCLLISWMETKETGQHYLVWHGLWHVFGAISGVYLSMLVTST